MIYVDDILIMSSQEELTIEVKQCLHSLFTVKDLVIAKYFLGVEVAQTARGTYISHVKYITNLIEDA